ncbi:MAG: transposase, partial [Candidatus Competibacteraceae bacterium]|nr:transposase [Candidatus Competibacteraceae bacterium]
MTKRQTYTKEFKIEAVRLLEESEKSGMEISRELGIRRNQLYKWQKELQSKG